MQIHGSGMHPMEPTPGLQGAQSSKANKETGGAGDSLKRLGVLASTVLPFSSRGVAFNLVRTPIRLAQSAFSGIAGMVAKGSAKSFASEFSTTMSAHMKKDWGGGISDVGTKLSPKDEKAQGIAKENLPYARMVYGSNVAGVKTVKTSDCPEELQPLLNKIKELGFEQDGPTGVFYSKETGTCFRLMLDESKNEIVATFRGLGNENDMLKSRGGSLDDRTVATVGHAAMKSAGTDFFGQVNKAALQVIDLGKAIKEESGKLKGSNDQPFTAKMVGHSHGGGLAQTAAAANGLEGVTFNSRPMGAGVRMHIGQSTIAKNSEKIVAFSGEGDYLTACTSLNVLAKVTERLTGLALPRNVGKEYHLPPAKEDRATVQDKTDGRQTEFSYVQHRMYQHCSFVEQLDVVAKGVAPKMTEEEFNRRFGDVIR